MNFDIVRPCPGCPFSRADDRTNLRRAYELAGYMLRDNLTFACHHTTVASGDDDGENVAHDDSQHCAGALIFAQKHADDPMTSNWRLQIAERLGLFDPSRLDPAAFADVFDSEAEMVEAHRKALKR